ncbi:MAG TPA: amylo-alpha-1,6-glucosidase [Cyanobacteria bacterium UBA8803]|nr:amylo-alpha-1,6-glucosidase [Cyanobacteria bacterium UBA9273]HBL57208.1 amylo-alpha-1,6-glucosidase [Cyanobacteria bacterium UBA8803]
MNYLDRREWLLTNGLGSFASGTVCDARTRTYHGWLIAALDPPGRRTLLLSHFDASLEIAGKVWAISTNFWDRGKTIAPFGYQLLRSFEINPVPQWVWGYQQWQLTRQVVMPYGLQGNGGWTQEIPQDSCSITNCQYCNRILIHYRYEGNNSAILRLRPLIADRDFHHQQSADENVQFSQLVGEQGIYLQCTHNNQVGTPWQLRWSRGDYEPEGVWYWNYYYPEENQRGLGDKEDLYSPGYLRVRMHPGSSVTLEARVGCPDAALPQLNSQLFGQAVLEEQKRQNQLYILGSTAAQKFYQLRRPQHPETPIPETIWHQLLQAGDRFIAYRASINGPTVIAGYPWFNDWGRDTLIALPGLALATGNFALAKGLLKTFASYCQDGLIPNTFPDAGAEPIYNSIDASLWWLETLGLYLETTQDWDFLIQQYPVVRKIYKAYTAGTRYQIQVDAADGLLTWDAPDVAITWMDVVLDGQPITPRRGKPVEINALWYSALCWIGQWTEKMVIGAISDRVRLMHHAQHYFQQAQKVKASLQKFWNPDCNYFFDTIAPDDRRDARIRPNAVLALSLAHCGFPEDQARRVLQVARERLLTPYGLRSLDPTDPDYIGYYSGDRWHRDRAYHQGTVWSWLIGPFSRAWKRFYPTEPLPFDWQPLLDHLQQQAGLGSISEIFDGNPPHLPQGAIAQAWSVAELIRHFANFE